MEEQELLQRARGGDQAAFGLLMEQYERQVYRQALGLVGLGTAGGKKVKKYSMGMKRRLGIALAPDSMQEAARDWGLETRPLDEPSLFSGIALVQNENGCDTAAGRAFWEYFRSVAQSIIPFSAASGYSAPPGTHSEYHPSAFWPLGFPGRRPAVPLH